MSSNPSQRLLTEFQNKGICLFQYPGDTLDVSQPLAIQAAFQSSNLTYHELALEDRSQKPVRVTMVFFDPKRFEAQFCPSSYLGTMKVWQESYASTLQVPHHDRDLGPGIYFFPEKYQG